MTNEDVQDAVAAVPHVVIVEEDRNRGWYGEDDHRWTIAFHERVEGGREAEERAERLAREHIPLAFRYVAEHVGRPGRTVFRMADGSWLVDTWAAHYTEPVSFRVSTGRLVHEEPASDHP